METVMTKPLEREFEYYVKNQPELVKKFNGKFLVIKDAAVFGAYNSEPEAIMAGSKKFELGTFLVQKCEPGSESYTQTFHSRVVACA